MLGGYQSSELEIEKVMDTLHKQVVDSLFLKRGQTISLTRKTQNSNSVT